MMALYECSYTSVSTSTNVLVGFALVLVLPVGVLELATFQAAAILVFDRFTYSSRLVFDKAKP